MTCAWLVLNIALHLLARSISLIMIRNEEIFLAALRVKFMLARTFELILNRNNIFDVFTYLRQSLLNLLGAICCDSEM